MMEAFDLAYRIGDAGDSEDVALIVDRLPDAPPPGADRLWVEARAAPGTREVAIIYKLTSRQAGIPTWFIAREHRYTTGLHWRYGALLHDRDPGAPAWALLTDDGREQPTVTLRVAGAYPVRFLSVLTEALDNIIEARYPGLVEARLVPCACQDHAGGACAHAFTLEELLAEATASEPDADRKVRCPKTRRKIEAALMLDGLRGTGLTAQLDDIRRTLSARHPQRHRRLPAGRPQRHPRPAREPRQRRRALPGPVQYPEAQEHRPAAPSAGHRDPLVRMALGPHPLDGDDGSYTVTKMPAALIRYLPYLRYLITALGLAAPVIGSAGVMLSDQAKDQVEAAAKTLELIEKHAGTSALASGHELHVPVRARDRSAPRPARTSAPSATCSTPSTRTTRRTGARLSPVTRPEDLRIIYLCPLHIHDLDYPYTATPPAP